MEEVLLSVMYDIPSRKDVARVLINREVVLDKVIPTLVPREAASAVKRERREKDRLDRSLLRSFLAFFNFNSKKWMAPDKKLPLTYHIRA